MSTKRSYQHLFDDEDSSYSKKWTNVDDRNVRLHQSSRRNDKIQGSLNQNIGAWSRPSSSSGNGGSESGKPNRSTPDQQEGEEAPEKALDVANQARQLSSLLSLLGLLLLLGFGVALGFAIYDYIRISGLSQSVLDGGAACPPGGCPNASSPTNITVQNTTTGAPGSNASVTNAGTPTDAKLVFIIPRGDPGPNGTCPAECQNGTNGNSSTVNVGNTTTLPPGSMALVTNVGTTMDAVFDFFSSQRRRWP